MDKKIGRVLQICLFLIILLVAGFAVHHYLSARPVQEETAPGEEEAVQGSVPQEERRLPENYYETVLEESPGMVEDDYYITEDEGSKEVKEEIRLRIGYRPEKHDINSLYTVLMNRDKLPEYRKDYFDCSEMSAYLEWYLEGMGFHSYIAYSDELDHMWVMAELDDGDKVAIEPALLVKGKNYSPPGIIEHPNGKYRVFSYKVEMYKKYVNKIGNDTSSWLITPINDIEKDPTQTYDYRWTYGESRSYPAPSYWAFAKNKMITIDSGKVTIDGDGVTDENEEREVTEEKYYNPDDLFDTPDDAIEKGFSISEFDWWRVLPWGGKEPFMNW